MVCGSRNKLGYLAHRAMVDEVVGLLGLIAEHCPQLTQSVSQIYDAQDLCGSDLYDLASDAIGSHEDFQAFGYGVTET